MNSSICILLYILLLAIEYRTQSTGACCSYPSCSAPPCPTAGTCTYATDTISCSAPGGTPVAYPTNWLGLGSSCSPNPCYQTNGGCCNNNNCTDVTGETCAEFYNGSPRGAGTSCSSGLCFVPCCAYNSSCSITYYQGQCKGSTGSEGSQCSSTVCPLYGTCCVNVSTCIDSMLVQECYNLGGIFDPGVYCSTSRCNQVSFNGTMYSPTCPTCSTCPSTNSTCTNATCPTCPAVNSTYSTTNSTCPPTNSTCAPTNSTCSPTNSTYSSTTNSTCPICDTTTANLTACPVCLMCNSTNTTTAQATDIKPKAYRNDWLIVVITMVMIFGASLTLVCGMSLASALVTAPKPIAPLTAVHPYSPLTNKEF